MNTLLLTNANVLDTEAGTLVGEHNVLVDDGVIVEMSNAAIHHPHARVLDLRGRGFLDQLLLSHDGNGHPATGRVPRDFHLLLGVADRELGDHTHVADPRGFELPPHSADLFGIHRLHLASPVVDGAGNGEIMRVGAV